MTPSVELTAAAPGTFPHAVPVRAGQVPAQYTAAAEAAGFTGKAETICDVLGGARRELLLGVGDGAGTAVYEAAGAAAASHILGAPRLAIDLRSLSKQQAISCLTGAVLRAWRYEALFSKPPEDAPALSRIDAITDDPALAKSWARQHAVLQGVTFARDLVTEPSNTLTPDRFVARLERLAEAGVAVEILRGEALRQAGLTGLLAVGGGSAHPPALAVLRWKGEFDAPRLAFVGKGITFDTGGICIKPADDMWEMRADMAGAAACAGAMLALALRKSPAPAIAVLALAENATGAASYRPGDVLRHASGTTIEVVDTDAEGRLVLADALGWVLREKPAAIIDLATLTGSVVTALGHEMAGLFSNDGTLAAAVSAAGAAVGERLWQLPIDASHRDEIRSDIADLRHCSPKRMQPDACQAAAFLREFAGGVPWVHLDIAGVESRAEADERHAKGATGFGVRLLDRLVRDRYEDPRRA
ncbi:MAG: leucyl aminopeptidase [Rhodospirillales bacterium]